MKRTDATDGSAGSRWELVDPSISSDSLWTVARADDGPFPVFSAARGKGDLPHRSHLEAMTARAVDDLCSSFGLVDPHGWMRQNITCAHDSGQLRSRRRLPLVSGPVHAVEVVIDTPVADMEPPGLLMEVLLHGQETATLLIAAEAYSAHAWNLYDESVVALNSLQAANALTWRPPRVRWTSAFPR